MIICILLSIHLGAQQKEVTPRVKSFDDIMSSRTGYKSALEFGFMIGFDDDEKFGFGLQTVQGMQLTRNFFAGLGTGFDFYEKPDPQSYTASEDEYYPPLEEYLFFPVFANIKWMERTNGLDLRSLSVDLGYSFLLMAKEEEKKVLNRNGGLYLCPKYNYHVVFEDGDGIVFSLGWKVQNYKIQREKKTINSCLFSISYYWK